MDFPPCFHSGSSFVYLFIYKLKHTIPVKIWEITEKYFGYIVSKEMTQM